MNFAVLGLLLLTVAGAFVWGIVVGHGWRILDALEARALDRIERWRVAAVTTEQDGTDDAR